MLGTCKPCCLQTCISMTSLCYAEIYTCTYPPNLLSCMASLLGYECWIWRRRRTILPIIAPYMYDGGHGAHVYTLSGKGRSMWLLYSSVPLNLLWDVCVSMQLCAYLAYKHIFFAFSPCDHAETEEGTLRCNNKAHCDILYKSSSCPTIQLTCSLCGITVYMHLCVYVTMLLQIPYVRYDHVE